MSCVSSNKSDIFFNLSASVKLVLLSISVLCFSNCATRSLILDSVLKFLPEIGPIVLIALYSKGLFIDVSNFLATDTVTPTSADSLFIWSINSLAESFPDVNRLLIFFNCCNKESSAPSSCPLVTAPDISDVAFLISIASTVLLNKSEAVVTSLNLSFIWEINNCRSSKDFNFKSLNFISAIIDLNCLE